MQDALYRDGSAAAKEAADMMAVAVDGYLRDQDLQQLRVSDVVFSDSTVALLLGRSARGESCKTGRDQGVVLDEPFSYVVLKRRTEGRAAKSKVFAISWPEYRRWWYWAAKQVTGSSSGAGPPHSARHTGASRDLSEGYRTLEEVMKRGRWKSLNSVHRYAKPHIWYACLASLSAAEKEKGNAILATRGARPAR